MKKKLLLKGAAILFLICALFFAGCKKEDTVLPHEDPSWLVGGPWTGSSQMTDSASFTINPDLSFSCTLNFKSSAPGDLASGTATITGNLGWVGLDLFEYMLTNLTPDAGSPEKLKSDIGSFNGLTAKFIPSGNSFIFVGTTPMLGAMADQFFGGTYSK
ncbi:MAG: hypothetical protein LBK08_06155 [Treponema sp.]|jgi:hypothetical protein|nr:hypothetical protein [Treponema sp.]